nr:MAG TPA: PRD PAIRED/DNA COMPLEX-DNA COMPLEX, DOUBLE HELIX, PAX.5A [Caudoviricetes sp.]
MREINEVIDGAKQVVNGIYEQIGRIDSCNAVLKVMDKAEVSLLLEDGELVDTSSALSIEQRADLLYSVRNMIKGNIDLAAAALEAVQNAGKKPAAAEYTQPEDTHEADAAEDAEEPGADTAAVPTVKKNNQPPERKSKMDKDTVLQLLKDGYSIQDIADRYGYKTTKTVDNFCKANKINTKLYERSDRQLKEADIPQIRALYTDGPFNLTQTAGELGVSKKQLRAFVEENHLVKPVAD